MIGQNAARLVKKVFKPEHVLVQANALASIQANSQIQKPATGNVSKLLFFIIVIIISSFVNYEIITIFMWLTLTQLCKKK